MSRTKKILLVFLVAFIAIQFIPSVRNQSEQMGKSDISLTLNTPERVQAILVNSCYDCHSNNTRHPWYARIQPVRYMLDKHIREGKEDLNLSEFGEYTKRRQINKLRSIESAVNDGTMPLSSYTLIHQSAKLTPHEKTILLNWLERAQDNLQLTR